MKSPSAGMIGSAHSLKTAEHIKTTNTMNNASCSSTMKQASIKEESRHFASTKSANRTGSQNGMNPRSTTAPVPIDGPSTENCSTGFEVTPATNQKSQAAQRLSDTTRPVERSGGSNTSNEQRSTAGISVSSAANDVTTTTDGQSYAMEQPSNISEASVVAEESRTKHLCGRASLAVQQLSTSALKLTSEMECGHSNNCTEGASRTHEMSARGTKVISSIRSVCDVAEELNLKQVEEPSSSVAPMKPHESTRLRNSSQKSTNAHPAPNSEKHNSQESSCLPNKHSRTPREGATNHLEQVTSRSAAAGAGGFLGTAPLSLRSTSPNLASLDFKGSSIDSHHINASETSTQGVIRGNSQQLQSVKAQHKQTNTAEANASDMSNCLKHSVPLTSATGQMSKKLESLLITTSELKAAQLSTKVPTPKVHNEDVSLINLYDSRVSSVTPYSRRESTC